MSDHKAVSGQFWRRWLLGALLAGGVVVAAGVGWQLWLGEQRRVALETARKADFAQAAPLLEKVLLNDPNDVVILKTLVSGHLASETPTAARPFLDRWCLLKPNESEPFQLRVDLRRKEQPQEALTDALHLVKVEPNSPDNLHQAAGLCFATGDFEQAESLCRATLAAQPGRRDARRLLAEILRVRGHLKDAAELLDALLHEKPDDTALMMGRAALYLEDRQPQAAIPLLEEVIRVDPTRQRTGRYQLTLAYEQAGRPEEARRIQQEMHQLQEAEVLRDALNSQPTNPDVQVRAARAWLAGKQLPAALDLLGQLLEKHPNHAGAHLALAEYFEKIGEPNRAAEHRRRAGGDR